MVAVRETFLRARKQAFVQIAQGHRMHETLPVGHRPKSAVPISLAQPEKQTLVK